VTTGRQAGRTLSRPVHALKRCFRCFLLIVLLLLAAGLYMNRVGLPDAVKNRVVRELAARGVRVEVARVRWELLEGIVMDDLLYFAGALDPEPVVRAEEATVNLRPAAWFRGRHGVRGFAIRNARLGTGEGLSGIHASVRLEDEGLQIRDLFADYGGLKITGEGFIARPQANLDGALIQAWRQIFPPSDKTEKTPALRVLLEDLKAVQFAQGSSAQIMLVLHPDDLNANELKIEARGGGLTLRGVNLEGWRMQAALKNGRFTLARLSVASGQQAVRAAGFLDLTDGTAACKLFSDLPPYVLLALAPVSLRQTLDSLEILPGEALEFTADAGPAPVGELLDVVHGSLALKDSRLLGLPVASTSLEFSREHQMLAVTNLQASVGLESRSGPLTGYARYDLESQTYSGRMNTGFDPGWMCPLVSTGKARVISGLFFRENLPQTSFTFSGQRGDDGAPLQVEGSVRGRNFSFRGTYFTSVESKLVMTNGVLILDPVTARRGSRACRGRIAFDFRNDIVDVDVESTFDPAATLRIMGPTLERLSRPFRFDGYTRISAKGSIDYETLTNMNLEAHVVASNMTYQHVAVESCAFDLLAKGRRFEVRNLQGVLYGGRLEMSRAVMESLADSPLWRYELALSLAGADFGRLMQAYRRVGADHPYEGRLDFMLAVAGETGEQMLLRMRGRGDIHISESRLLRIPLFGGLAKILSALYPNFGIVSKNDLTADFKIGGNSIRTQNARLLGHIISVQGSGRYHFTNNLDFKVRVRMLREGRLAALLDWLTFPVTKLLEFHLSGPLEQPVWRPDNLPKELFNMLKSVIPGIGDEAKR